METNNLKSLDGGTINSAINENVNDSTRVMNQVDNNIEKTEMRTEDMQPDKNGNDKNGQTAETQVLTPGNNHMEKGEEEYHFPTVEELLRRERKDILSLRRLPYTDIDYATYNWSVTQGCLKLSPGCKHCYAEVIARNQSKRSDTRRFKDGFKPGFNEGLLYTPLHDTRKSIVFVSPLGDFGHADITDEQRRAAIEVIQADKTKVFLILTKRPETLVQLFENIPVPSNCLLGVSVESEAYLSRMDTLRKIASDNLVVSFAPLLGGMKDINFDRFVWVLIEGEATRPMGNARMVRTEWIQSIIEQAESAPIPPAIYIKQLGKNVDGVVKSKAQHGYLVKGVSYRQYPQVIRTILKNTDEELEKMNMQQKKDKEMKKERSTTKKTTTAGTGSEAEALSHVIPLSKVVKEGAKKGKVNNLYGTWVVEGEVTVIAGDTNAGKSSVTYQMGLDAASGKNTLGFPAPTKPVVDEVVYIDTELSITQLGQRFGGITISDRMKYIDATAWDLERILSEIETISKEWNKKKVLFILDSITVAATGSITAKVAKELMKRLKLICGRYNVTVITLMHTRKRDKSKPIEMQDLAGSAKLTDLADNVLAMAKCNATEVYVKVLKSRSNAIPDKVRHFEIRSDGYLHLEFIRECEEEDLLAQGKSKLTPEVEQEILTLRGKGYSVRKIADHMKLSKSAIDRVVQKHKDSGESSVDTIKDAQLPDNAA